MVSGFRLALSDEDMLQRTLAASMNEARNATKPTSKTFMDSLEEEELSKAHILPVILRVKDMKKDIRCCRAKVGGLDLREDRKDPVNDGNANSSKVVIAEASVVMCEPIHGDATPKNKTELKGSICIMKRAKVSFAEKAKIAEEAGCSTLIVIQSKGEAWPYEMTDSSNSALKIPVAMVSHEDGMRLEDAINKQKKVGGSIFFIGVHLSCSICREDFKLGAKEKATPLPCGHLFHMSCIKPWLSKQNVCPLCRHVLPASEVVRNEDRARLRQRLGEEMFN